MAIRTPTAATPSTSTAPTVAAVESRARAGLALSVILTAQLMLVLDATIVNVALPVIREQFDFSPAELSWVLNAYTLSFGGLLLLGGRLGDVIGYRRTFIIGLALFVVSSALGGAAQTGAWLIAARAVQGVGAALAAPAALSLLTRTRPEGAVRNRALGLFGAVSSAGGSLGLILGGLLTTGASWRWSLLINVPIGIAAILLGRRLLPDTERRSDPFDLPGALAAVIGMTSLVAGFVWIPEYGWSLRTAGAITLGVLAMVGFVIIERRSAHPLFALRLLTDTKRVSALLAFMAVVAGQMAGFFFLVQYLQVVRGFSPLLSGLAFLPLTLGIFAMTRIVPRLMTRFHSLSIALVGMTLLITAHLLLSRFDADAGYAAGPLLPMILLGIGAGAAWLPLNARILAGVPAADAGSASGMLQTAQQAGGAALGLAILIATSGLGASESAQPAAAGLVDGIHRAFGTAALLVSLGLVISAGTLLREISRGRRSASDVA